MRKILLQKLSNYLEEQNKESLNLNDDISLNDYFRLKYDEFLELIKYCRYLIDMDILGKNSEYLNEKLLEYQNDFVSYLMRSTSIELVDIYYRLYSQVILSLFYSDNEKESNNEK